MIGQEHRRGDARRGGRGGPLSPIASRYWPRARESYAEPRRSLRRIRVPPVRLPRTPPSGTPSQRVDRAHGGTLGFGRDPAQGGPPGTFTDPGLRERFLTRPPGDDGEPWPAQVDARSTFQSVESPRYDIPCKPGLLYWMGGAAILLWGVLILAARVATDRAASRRILQGPAPTFQVTPDRFWWWDVDHWVPVGEAAPPNAFRAPDGNYWWAGAAWLPMPPRSFTGQQLRGEGLVSH